MDSKSRVLPHLHLYFLQKKAYEQHRKKISEIRSSYTVNRSKDGQQQGHLEEQQPPEGASQLPFKYSIHTIKQEIKNELNCRLSPFAKKLKQDAEKENERLFQRIKKCSSTINRKQMMKNHVQNQQIKDRLSKFIYNPYSNKTLLKCKHSLEIIRQKQSKKELQSEIISRIPSRTRHNKTEMTNIDRSNTQQESSGRDQIRLKKMQKKGSLDKLMLLRYSSKIKSHFEKSEFSTYARSNLEGIKGSLDSASIKKSMDARKYRGRCFTTEIV